MALIKIFKLMECLKLWIKNIIKLKSMMKVRKPNVPKQKKHCLNFWNKYWKCFEIENNHKVQYDYDNKCFLPKFL